MIAPEHWSIVECDPGWELRQGPVVEHPLADASVVSGSLVWTTDGGVSVALSIDGAPIPPTDLTLAQLEGLSLVTALLWAHWPTDSEGTPA